MDEFDRREMRRYVDGGNKSCQAALAEIDRLEQARDECERQFQAQAAEVSRLNKMLDGVSRHAEALERQLAAHEPKRVETVQTDMEARMRTLESLHLDLLEGRVNHLERIFHRLEGALTDAEKT